MHRKVAENSMYTAADNSEPIYTMAGTVSELLRKLKSLKP